MMEMLKSHEKFYAVNGKRLVLIVDDELINRELLKLILEDDYETITAPDGETALEIIQEKHEFLSLILLDLLMPGMHGLDLIRHLKEDPILRQIPVIVLTADSKAEVRSLKLGAVDFISKPYPDREVILARVHRTIELSEDREIIEYTERDGLTGLYNREYFFRFAQQYDQLHPGADMDAMVVDVHHFRMVNERYGKACGDDVLRRIGECVRLTVKDAGGIVCRREADTFLIYCPHREDYQAILDRASVALSEDGAGANRVRLRMGVYAHVDKTIDMERRFDRAKTAADTARSSYISSFALYDNDLHEQEIYTERLLEDFQSAIENKEFKVYYQPKFDIRPDIPVLNSAEALVRWIHPELGFISPGSFIPLFEENGLIQQLDMYVWRETAAQIRDWKERLGISVPVSVNVSRIDMYDPNLIATFESLLQEYSLTPEELLLEITESAYTQDSAQIISKVNHLRTLGFHIEMDDFGTGYSSLNMISTLPIDALKLDMTFIRNAFQDGGDTGLIEVIIDIADYLGVPVIAEGVETEEQVNALKAMGCDLVQGYYFSRPVPPGEYEPFLEEKKRRLPDEGEACLNRGAEDARTRKEIRSEDRGIPGRVPREKEREAIRIDKAPFTSVARALTADFFSIYYVDTETDRFIEYSAHDEYDRLGIEKDGEDFFNLSRKNILRVVHPEDHEKILNAFTKEKLLSEMEKTGTFTLNYRLIMGGEPTWVSMKASRMPNANDKHIVIGVNNIDAQMQRQMEFDAAKAQSVTFASIAQALAADYFSIYYVDTVTDHFVEYSAHDDYKALGIEKSGEDFFNLSRANILRVVHPQDQDKILDSFTKDNLLAEMEKTGTFTLNYRLMFGDKVNYVSMKATRMADENDKHIVIGVNNISAQMQRQLEYDAARAESDMYSRIAQALSKDYYSIYLVNTETDDFIEYSSTKDYQSLQVENNGTDFFKVCRRNVLRLVYKEDLEKALAVWDKSRLMPMLEDGKTFFTTYRLMMNGAPVYINCKVIRMEDDLNRNYIVIGVSNVDDQVRRDKELITAREKANRDALTGTKSKHAYVDAVAEINVSIDMGAVKPFAVVVCDVNGLKTVNDTQGHHAGDKLIRDASDMVCGIFKHSPIFRVGGDEFVAILQGADYEQRVALVAEMMERNRKNRETGSVVIACGTAEWNGTEDNRFEAVFDRADTAMYENKMTLKAQQ